MPPVRPRAVYGRRMGCKKSRNGCLRCKTRHVKCDEQRPCQNCVRHGVRCSLSLTVSLPKVLTLAPNGQRTSASSPNLDIEDGRQPAEPCPQSSKEVWPTSLVAKASAINKLAGELESEIKALNQEPPETHNKAGMIFQGRGITEPLEHGHISSAEWMRSLQLLHHYSTSTCLTLPFDSSTVQLWKVTVPEIAVSYEFLMHGLLAVSALHYAHLNPEQRKAYTIVSIQYQTLALESFSTRLTDINEGNCQAYFLLSSFIFILTTCSIANPQDREEAVTLKEVAQSFILLQGVKNILEFPAAQNWGREGPLSTLLQPWVLREATANERSSPFIARLENLSTLIQELPTSPKGVNPQSSCHLALESLKITYLCSDDSTNGLQRIWLWPFTVPQAFLDLLGDGHPTALIMLAHFAALARPFEDLRWMQRGWSSSIIAVVKCSLDEQWKKWIEWPMRCIQEGLGVGEMVD